MPTDFTPTTAIACAVALVIIVVATITFAGIFFARAMDKIFPRDLSFEKNQACEMDGHVPPGWSDARSTQTPPAPLLSARRMRWARIVTTVLVALAAAGCLIDHGMVL